mmetsp:Transcript_70813/g.133823  ORF Transcript_70813/g.133823 Transcript_70813/m.133823 type:complete len:503 (+) Transcript_70813:71-1579(+)
MLAITLLWCASSASRNHLPRTCELQGDSDGGLLEIGSEPAHALGDTQAPLAARERRSPFNFANDLDEMDRSPPIYDGLPDDLPDFENLDLEAMPQEATVDEDALKDNCQEFPREIVCQENGMNFGTAQDVYDQVTCLTSHRDVNQAELLLKQLLACQDQLLGPDHENTLTTTLNLANLLTHHQHKYDKAEVFARRAKQGLAQALGEDSNTTLKAESVFASLKVRQGDMDAATPIFRRVLKRRTELFGKEDPDTLLSKWELAHCLSWSTGAHDYDYSHLAEAEDLLKDVIQNYRLLRSPSISVTEIMLLLVTVYDWLHQPYEVEPLLEEVIKRRRNDLGETHPLTLKAIYILAKHLSSRSWLEPRYDLDYARELLQPTIGDMRREMEEADYLKAAALYASILDTTGGKHHAAAESWYNEALDGMERVFGKDHPRTQQVRKEFESLEEAGRASLPLNVKKGVRQMGNQISLGTGDFISHTIEKTREKARANYSQFKEQRRLYWR